MTKLLVLYYSTYGHVETMAGAIAEGARSVDGVEVTLKADGSRQPREKELSLARFRGKHVAGIAAQMKK